MALPAHLLERFPPAFAQAGVRLARPANGPEGGGLRFGIPELDALLPDGGLLRGGVVELCAGGEGALGTSLALAACAQAQVEVQARAGRTPWCAFVDPSGTLYGPGVAAAGVELSRLLVVRPPLAALSRVALRLAESEAFAVVVVDLSGVVGERVAASLGTWPRVVRRLAMAVEGTGHSVVLLTRQADRRPLPLPVAQRLEVSRPAADKLLVRLAKDQRGRISSPRPIAWSRGNVWGSVSAASANASWGPSPTRHRSLGRPDHDRQEQEPSMRTKPATVAAKVAGVPGSPTWTQPRTET